jgi:hypothetical protein
MPREWNEIKDVELPELGMPLEALSQKLEQVEAQLKEIKKAHKDYTFTYTKDARAVAYSQGLIHGEEEEKSLTAILDAAIEFPSYVASLSNQDGGEDDDSFEADLLAARLEAVKRLQRVSAEAQSLAHLFDDTAASVGTRSKPILGAAYRILKNISSTLPKLKSTLAPAIDFFRAQRGSSNKTSES